MNSVDVFTAKKIFNGQQWLHDHALIIDNGLIKELLPAASLPVNLQANYYEEEIIVPAFIDLQIYGAGGKLFAVYPTTEALKLLTDYCRKGGAVFCLPTVATNTYDVMHRCIDAIREYWLQGGKGVYGLHLEGPWINAEKRGAHIKELVHSPTLQQAAQLLNYGKGVIKMITLAPEVCSDEVIELIRSHNIVISAGHSNATYSQAMNAFSKGIPTVTHLYNAMTALQHRAPGLAGAAMDSDTVFASIIPDGLHVDYAAVRIAKKILQHRLFAITDAVTETAEGYYRHQYADEKYEAAGILSGSALTMHKAFKNLVTHAGVETGEALRMCSLYPAQVIGVDDQFGKIAKGFSASLLIMSNAFEIKEVIG